MKQKIAVFIVIAVILGGAVIATFNFSQNPEQLIQLKLKLGLVNINDISGIVTASGYIEAEDFKIVAETRGRIRKITANEGDFVEAGQSLVELDTALLETDIQQAKAKITTAKARLAKIKAGVRAEEVAKVEAAVAMAETKAEAARIIWRDTITLRDNPQLLDMQIDAAKTALKLAELQIKYAIPLKDANETIWELGKQQWEFMQESQHACRTHPITGEQICKTINFKEGNQQQAGLSWNYAGADMWAAWVDLNSSITKRDDTEAILNDLMAVRDNRQEMQARTIQAEAAYKTALTEIKAAKAKLQAIQAGLRPEQIAVATAVVNMAEAALEALQVDRNKHTLTAPSAGWVVNRTAQEGEMATPGLSLMTVADTSNVTLIIYVAEPDIDLVKVGQKLNLFVDSFPNRPFIGHITFISSEAEFTPKNVQTREERNNTVFAVKIRLENQEQLLKPGMPADAVLVEGTKI